MDTTQIVIITLLAVVEVGLLLSMIYRSADFQYKLWIEPLAMAVVGLFIYLVAR